MTDAPGTDGAGDRWSNRVVFDDGPDLFAYRPGEIIVAGERGVDVAERLFGGRLRRAEPEPLFPPTDTLGGDDLVVLRADEDVDVVTTVDVLVAEGAVAQPNHVFFANGACCGPHPSQRWAATLTGAPLYANPSYANAISAMPLRANPLRANPADLLPTGRPRSTARPVTAPPSPPVTMSGTAPAAGVRVAVLDTGMAANGVRPHALNAFADDTDHHEVPDDDGDRHVDPAAGHGTFIAGLVDLLAPGCELTVERVLTNDGDGDEKTIARRIHALAGRVDLVNLSFGGYTLTNPRGLAAAVRHVQATGAVVVASAGNDGSCRRTFPAALRGVVGVGAVGPHGPAPFTNYGPWVRACAPGVDVVSRFFTALDSAAAASGDTSGMTGWAQWSGTSFAAPAVVAALAADMACRGGSPRDAVRRVVDAPGLLRIPDLGTVVNVG